MARSRRPAGLPDFDNPPLVEVALSIQSDALSVIEFIELDPAWTQLRRSFPKVEEHPPLPPAFEIFGIIPSATTESERVISIVKLRGHLLAAALAGLFGIAHIASAADITKLPLGMHQAGCPDGSTADGEAGLRCWEQILNRPIGSMYDVGDAVEWRGCWNNYDSGINPAWHTNVNRQLVYNVGFFPDWYGCPGQWPTITAAAADVGGVYSAHWRGVAQDLVNKGYATAAHPVIIRPAWEFDGSWYPWGNGNPYGDDCSTVAYPVLAYQICYSRAFRRLVEAFRSVSPNFKFVWNPTSEAALPTRMGNGSDPTQDWRNAFGACNDPSTWPDTCLLGYADYVGLDVYDNPSYTANNDNDRWTIGQINPMQCRTNPVSGGAFCQLSDMAHNYAVPIVFPEWAAGEGGDAAGGPWPHDNPTFISNMAAYMVDPTLGGRWPRAAMAWHSYWSGDAASGYCGWINTNSFSCPPRGIGGYPNQRAAYIARFKTP